MENIITIITSSLGFGALIVFALRSYLGEKFKNIATIEDIGEITREVETVKKIFQNDNERLKSQLSILTNKHTALFEEERKALVEYLSAWTIWYSHVVKMPVTYRDYNNEQDVSNGINEMMLNAHTEQDKTQLPMSKLILFLKDKNVLDAARKLDGLTFDFQVIHQEYMLGYIKDSYNKTHMTNRLKKSEEQEEEKEIINEIQASLDLLIDEMSKKKNEFKLKILEHHKTMYTQQANFIALARDYIRK